jgi:N-acetylneuraminic acid mutarotase
MLRAVRSVGVAAMSLLTFGLARQAQADSFAPTGSMATARLEPSATLLADGRVLVAGGHDFGTTTFNTAEIYAPASGSWSAAGTLSTPRTNHTATRLGNGKVLVAGGVVLSPGGTALSSAELYDPTTNAWSTTASMATARWGASASLLPNGKVLVAGGFGDRNNSTVLASAEIYDPNTNAWSPAGALSVARAQYTATLLANGMVLAAGGAGSPGGTVDLASAEIYYSITNAWSPAGTLTVPRRRHTATRLPNGKVLIVGGTNTGSAIASAELYDPATNAWSSAASLSAARVAHSATLLNSGKVLVAGGATSSIPRTLMTTEVYDPAQATWSADTPLLQARYYHVAMKLADGSVLVAGGTDPDDGIAALTSAEVFTEPPPPPVPAFPIVGLLVLAATLLAAGLRRVKLS